MREGRGDKLDESKQRYCQKTEARTLADVVKGADVFLGCSAAGVMNAEMVKSMADKPIILALANPEPEIRPELAKAARPDCIIATGRSDYPNQVNNVLCFPYIFRGALDCGATKINEAMKLACVREIAALAKAETSDEVAAAYSGRELKFGPDYLIPTPFDVRLILRIAPGRGQGGDGVGRGDAADRRPGRLPPVAEPLRLPDRPVHAPGVRRGQGAGPARVVYAEGEDERVLRAVQVVLDEGLAKPILVGRPEVIRMRIERAGLRLAAGRDFEVCDPEDDPRFRSYWETYAKLMGREGVTPEAAKAAVRRSNTLIAALMLRRGEADGMLCGLVGRYDSHLEHVRTVIGHKSGMRTLAAMNALMLDQHTLFIADTFVNDEPSAEELADIAMMAAAEVRRFGLPPKVAFLSHSIFGSSQRASARRMRAARDLFVQRAPDIECDGEMHGDAALSRKRAPQLPARQHAQRRGQPAGAAQHRCREHPVQRAEDDRRPWRHGGPDPARGGLPAHILTPSATVRRIVNMTALAVADAADVVAQPRRSSARPAARIIRPALPPAHRKTTHAPRHQDRRHARPRIQRPRRARASAARRRRRGAAELQPRHGAGPYRPGRAGARHRAAHRQAGGADGRPAGPEDPRRQVRRGQRDAGQRRGLRARRARASEPGDIGVRRPGLQGTAARRASPGDTLLLNDGLIVLTVAAVRGEQVHTVVKLGGVLSNNKGINKAGGGLTAPALTAKDMEDIKTAMSLPVRVPGGQFPEERHRHGNGAPAGQRGRRGARATSRR